MLAILAMTFAGGVAHAQGLPDLVPWKLKVDAGGAGAACEFGLRLTVKNKGDADAGAYVVDVAVIKDGVELFEFPMAIPDGTVAHAKTILSSGVGYTSGTYRIEIEVNRFAPIPESDVTNNHLSSGTFACPA